MESNLLCDVPRNQKHKSGAMSKKNLFTFQKLKDLFNHPLRVFSKMFLMGLGLNVCRDKHAAQSHCCLIQHNGESHALSVTAKDPPP